MITTNGCKTEITERNEAVYSVGDTITAKIIAADNVGVTKFEQRLSNFVRVLYPIASQKSDTGHYGATQGKIKGSMTFHTAQ